MSRREDYIERAKEKLDLLNADLAKLEARANSATGAVKREIRSELDDIRKSKEDAETRLQELRSASDSAWEDLKAGAEQAWRSLSRSVEIASARFK